MVIDYPFVPSLFVSGTVGVETLELRRKIMLFTHYCLLLRHEIDNPPIQSFRSRETGSVHAWCSTNARWAAQDAAHATFLPSPYSIDC